MTIKSIEKIQTILPIGYLLLVVLGIIKESVFFYQIGINILKYSSIMDILISPLATLTLHPIVLISVIILFVLHFYLPKFLFKHSDRKWVQKAFELKVNKDETSEQELKNLYNFIAIKTLIGVLLSFFLGFGIAGGYGVSKKIQENKLDYNYKLNFTTGESEEINIIGSNSVYYFYVSKGNKNVKIAPVSAVKSIELSKNKMLDK